MTGYIRVSRANPWCRNRRRAKQFALAISGFLRLLAEADGAVMGAGISYAAGFDLGIFEPA
jgi:hypothetical protein